MDSEKKSRAKNFSDSEIGVFTDIILPKYASIIENKKSDAVTRKEKAAAWTALTVEFNACSNHCFRTEGNLKNLWDKLKRDARKSKAAEKKETFATGGGSRDPSGTLSTTNVRVLAVLGPSGVGLLNHFDGDADESLGSAGSPATENLEQTLTSIDFSSIVVAPVEESQQQEVVNDWSEPLPRMFYQKKAEALRVASACPSTSSSSSSSAPATSSASTGSQDMCATSPLPETVRKRTIAEELEWAKRMKRRRPNVGQDDSQLKLTVAKLELAEATKQRIEQESIRGQELFEVQLQKFH